MTYLAITNWKRYQHYQGRRMIWLKFYVDLLEDEELLALPPLVQLLWDRLLLLAAQTSNAIPNDAEWIARRGRLPVEVCAEGVPQLLKGRWIQETKTRRRASKPASKPDSKGLALDTESEKGFSEPQTVASFGAVESEETSNGGWNRLGVSDERFFAQTALFKCIRDADDGTWDLVGRLSAQLPVSVLHSLRETLETRGDIKSHAGYVVGSLKAELEKRKVPA